MSRPGTVARVSHPHGRNVDGRDLPPGYYTTALNLRGFRRVACVRLGFTEMLLV